MHISYYQKSFTTLMESPTNSPFRKLPHNHHKVSNGLVMMSLRNYNFVACCQSKGNHMSPNGFLQIATMRSSVVTAKHQKKMGLADLVSCDEAKGSTNVKGLEAGVGIAKFLRGKSFFITGATGFLAKVLIEKILRTTPDVHKIYVLIQSSNKEGTFDRVKNEILNTELFRLLQEFHGNDYPDFMMKKLIPVMGNVREANMGIETAVAEEISKEVDVIVNSAANTTFDERYDVALDINTIGPIRLLSFAKRFKRLKLFLQISTAYVNGKRQGRVMEKPFLIGDNIAKELVSHEISAKSMPWLDIEAEIRLAFNSMKAPDDAFFIQEMKDLGLKRANIYGWQDTYVFTKAMAEMVIECLRGDIPVVIIRPSVIESTWKEPFPGWMEGNRMMDPVVLYYGKGQLTGFLADPKGVLDVVPVDMVVNATLGAMTKHGWTKEPGIHIYHVASSIVNPLTFQELANLLHQHFKSFPSLDSKGRPIEVLQMKLFDDVKKFSSYVNSNLMQQMSLHEKVSKKFQNICMKIVDQAKYLANIYEPYTFYGGRFDNTNTQNLMGEMSEEERKKFGFDVGEINWEDYISNVHIPGLRRYVMKGRGMCADTLKFTAAKV
ncbi:fatty acyl-CoA reductase 2-like [Phalaenopsis equestris]|uniref:fatty acyl-CoA reductase 2-like n=1 Tax=Phalaenopsis equestris TaxID=78828 RepID=UPI0009E2864C|nr:fatty acyl-CoA reductase 2-like [Phalaenopsis equestris]